MAWVSFQSLPAAAQIAALEQAAEKLRDSETTRPLAAEALEAAAAVRKGVAISPGLVRQLHEITRGLTTPELSSSPASRLLKPRVDLFGDSGKINATLWQLPDREEAARLFEQFFYPAEPVSRLIDLGAGYGEFVLHLARLFPKTAI